MSADVFDLDLDPLTRDRWGRPMLVPHGGGEKVPYTRASTLAGYVADSSALSVWERRNVAIGMATRPDLCALVATLPPLWDAKLPKTALNSQQRKRDAETKRALDEAIEAAKEQAHGVYKARMGTALHAACEPGGLHEWLPEDIAVTAGRFHDALTSAGIRIVASERFVANETLMAAGSFDHLVHVPGHGYCILDIKSGAVQPGTDGLKHAIQLVTYATAELYDVDTDERTPLASLTEGEQVNPDFGLIVHAPIGGEITLYGVDLEVGMRGAKLATMVRTARGLRDTMYRLGTLEVAS